MDREKALEAAISQIERNCGKGSIMRLGQNEKAVEVEAISTGSLGLDIALGIGGLPRGRVVEIYGPEILRQDHARAPRRGRGAEARRHLRLHRRRARARHGLCAETRCRSRKPPDLPAGHRRAGARDHRHSGPLRRHRRAGDRFRRGADAEGRARRRDGRHADGQPGPFDEPGLAQAHGLDLQIPLHGHLHQPDPHEDRRDVRLARDHERRQCLEVLCLGAPRHQAHRRHQGARGGGRQPDPRQGGEEQGGARPSSRSSSTSCTARASPRPAS